MSFGHPLQKPGGFYKSETLDYIVVFVLHKRHPSLSKIVVSMIAPLLMGYPACPHGCCYSSDFNGPCSRNEIHRLEMNTAVLMVVMIRI